MIRPRLLQGLYSLGLEFWLPLPLLGLVFWVGSGLVTQQMLNHSYNPKAYLQTDMQLQRSSRTVVLIKVEIKKEQGFAKVRVKTDNSALKELEFEFPATESSQIEAAIGQELGLSTEYVRKLVRYQIEDRRYR
jgi:cell division protein FtsX